jgi:hypothetical protein
VPRARLCSQAFTEKLKSIMKAAQSGNTDELRSSLTQELAPVEDLQEKPEPEPEPKRSASVVPRDLATTRWLGGLQVLASDMRSVRALSAASVAGCCAAARDGEPRATGGESRRRKATIADGRAGGSPIRWRAIIVA